MPSCSRYFATVRREISNPFSFNTVTIAWSESGFRLSSPLISAEISFLTSALEAASSPPAERTGKAVVKNVFNGKVPNGVSIYFSLTARLTVDSCIPMSSEISFIVSGFKCPFPYKKKSRCFSSSAAPTFSSVFSGFRCFFGSSNIPAFFLLNNG